MSSISPPPPNLTFTTSKSHKTISGFSSSISNLKWVGRNLTPKPTRYASLILLMMRFLSCALVYIFLFVVLKPNDNSSISELESLSSTVGDGNGGGVEGGFGEESERCCKGMENLELWCVAVKWGSEFKFNSSEECCKACKGMCSGNDGPCLCDSWVFCGDRKSCGLKFGEVRLIQKFVCMEF